MDDIYFSGNNNNRDDYDIPTVNIPDINGQNADYPAYPNNYPEGGYGGGYQNNGGFNPPPYYPPQGGTYAPYRGKEKRDKSAKRGAPVPPPQQDNKKGKKKKGCFRPVRIIAAILVLMFIGSFFAVLLCAGFSGYTKTSLKHNEYIRSSQLANDPFIQNILLIGVDGADGTDSLRSDSMMLVSVDLRHGKIKLTSFMRDSWVFIPDYKYSKLNAAFSHGGAQLVADTIEYNFKVDIDDYVLVNFTMFTEIIDALGGVDVEVTEKEARFINRTTRQTVDSGPSVHLNGEEALVYCRIRKLDSDYMRTYRQRKVIKALMNEISLSSLPSLLSVISRVLPKVETNMNPVKIAFLAYKGGFSALFFKIESTRIPTDDYSRDTTIGGQSVVEIDVDANADYLYNFIYNDSADALDGQD
ncbi:MAG: LCP family protein [Clostridia bacterium]|nr:LCP family protein [Clostridia bacterium]